jgi:hypothetical protein
MANKDPATLWYWNDWIGGTMTMTRQEKGAYMDLLTAQFNSGHLTDTQIKKLLGQDQGLWVTVLREKFLVDGDGKYYNKRLDDEIKKRRAFSLKQSLNGQKGGRKKGLAIPTLKPNESLLEDEIENEDENKIELSKNGFFSDTISKETGLSEMQVNATIEFISLICKVTVTEKDVGEQWKAFKIQQLGKHEWYNSFESLLSHFRNSLKLLMIKNGSRKTNSTNSERGDQVESLLSGINE